MWRWVTRCLVLTVLATLLTSSAFGQELIAALVRDGASEEDAVKYFCLMVLNLNEFVYLD